MATKTKHRAKTVTTQKSVRTSVSLPPELHDTLARMAKVSVATHHDATLCIPTRFSLGFMKSMDNRALENAEDCSVVLSEPAFGHVGAGGSLGFADPQCGLSFGYAMNRMGAGILLNDRGQSLVDAAYRALGFRSNAGGVWAT